MRSFFNLIFMWCLGIGSNAQYFQPIYTPLDQQYFLNFPLPTVYTGQQTYQNVHLRSDQNIAREQKQKPSDSDNYRGFGYHTNFDDGASTTVVFFRGGSNIAEKYVETPKITVASDSLDPQTPKDAQNEISRIFEGKMEKNSYPKPLGTMNNIVKSFLENPQRLNGIFHFYSAPRFLASTTPLTSLHEDRSSSSSNSSKGILKEERETAESVQTRTVLDTNDIENIKEGIITSRISSANNNSTGTTVSNEHEDATTTDINTTIYPDFTTSGPSNSTEENTKNNLTTEHSSESVTSIV